ncbi:MAG TPA: 2-oxoacid:acceptor oxidoreductase family protein [Deltaproteobacteria bacterium]|nr:2-oxoacid:acceptor oxidoreductase family protein [Deltaproteobacteria bacterium]
MKDTIDIRWHGRGGQGAITAAKIVAKTLFREGFQGVVMIPTFGTERRGAPVFTSLKISRNKIYDLSPIQRPDIVVVLDHVLMGEADVTGGLKSDGLLVINSPCSLEAYHEKAGRVAVCNVTELSMRAGLPAGVVNTGIIGAFARAADFVGLDPLLGSIEEEFDGRGAAANVRAARLAYEHTIIGG